MHSNMNREYQYSTSVSLTLIHCLTWSQIYVRITIKAARLSLIKLCRMISVSDPRGFEIIQAEAFVSLEINADNSMDVFHGDTLLCENVMVLYS